MALCVACHREQPYHAHMFIGHAEMQTINHLRREQGLLHSAGWNKVSEFCDPGLRRVLDACRHQGTNVPEVGSDVQDAKGAVVASLDLAWPQQRVGLAISDEDRAAAQKSGWRIWRINEALENKEQFTTEIKD